MMRADDIATKRLVLRLMGREVVAAALAGDAETGGRLLGTALPPELFAHPSSLTYGIMRMDEDPLYAPWGPRAILLDGEMIGHIRFHTRPDPPELRQYAPEAAEFGYRIFAAHRRHGYAAEAARAVMGWAARSHGVRNFVLTISPDNVASLALAARLGFVQVGEQMDEVDGLELVLLRRPSVIRAATPDDIAAIRALLVETWHHTYDAILGADFVTDATDRWHAPDILAAQAASPEAAFLVAAQNCMLTGHAYAHPLADGTLRLSRLYVRPAAQRNGVGEALLAAALARFPAASRVSLEVEARNAKGIAFYARHGFTVIGEIAEEGSRPLLMAKALR